MTRRARVAAIVEGQGCLFDASGRPTAPPAPPVSETRRRPFVVRLGADIAAGTIFLDLDGAESIGRWPEGEPALVELDPGAVRRVMAQRRARVLEEMRRKGKAGEAPAETGAKVDKRATRGRRRQA